MNRAFGVVASLLLGASHALAKTTPGTWRVIRDSAWQLRYEAAGIAGDGKLEAMLLAGGALMVAEPGEYRVHVFAPDGRRQVVFGRRGEGPGEFTPRIRLLGSSRDTLFIGTGSSGPGFIHLFRTDGRFLRRVQARAEGAATLVVLGRLAGGDFVAIRGGFTAFGRVPSGLTPTKIVPGVLRDPFGSPAFMPLAERRNQFLFSYPVTGLPVKFMQAQYELAGTTETAILGNRFLVGDGGSGTVAIHRASGDLDLTFQVPWAARPYRSAAMDSARRHRLRLALRGNDSSRIRMLYSAELLPRHAPLFQRLVGGGDDMVWVEEFDENPANPRRYRVLDSRGRQLARLELPEGRLASVAGDRLIAIAADDDGVDRVIMYRLAR